jgi:hypothetical protein
VEVVDLGTVSFGGESTGSVFVDVTPDVVSFHVAARTTQHVAPVGLFRLIGPDGTELYHIERQNQFAVRAHPGDGQAQVLYPNTPLVSIRPGRYQVEFVTNADPIATFSVEAVLKRGQPSNPKLDLNLFFVGVPGLSASTARNDAAFSRVLSRLTQLYAQAGITVGQIQYVDVSASDSDRLGVVDTIEGLGNELDQLFSLANQYTNDDHFNFYLVRSISAGAGANGLEILGIADGIPGRISLPNRLRSGVAVTMAYYQEDPESVGFTMAHEGGHFLGLFHTSERDGSQHDPLPDTPQCLISADTNNDGLLDANECAGSGAQNVMFWLSAPSAVQLTQNQTFVLHQNPGVR